MRIHDCALVGDCAGVERELMAGVPVDARQPVTDLTPLAEAAGSEYDTLSVMEYLLAKGADPNAEGGLRAKTPVLQIAAKEWDPSRLRILIGAGANVEHRMKGGYDVLIGCFYSGSAASPARLLNTVKLLIGAGAPVDGASDHGETALSVASRRGYFGVIGLLLDAGADAAELRWSPLHRAVALDTVQDVAQLARGSDLEVGDRWQRTPWLLSSILGDLEKAKCLASNGCDKAVLDRFSDSAVAFAIRRGHGELFTWLLTGAGMVWDQASLTAALVMAAGEGESGMTSELLGAGASPGGIDEHGETAMQVAATVGVWRLLGAAGGYDGVAIKRVRQVLAGLEPDAIDCSPEEFFDDRGRRFGAENPERMDVPFWRAMVAARSDAWEPRARFDPDETATEADWCFSRYGQSITELDDGRVVEVGGEHEDYCDPDFCIYNDVVVYDGKGGFTIYGYPKDVFPPTDFHTATLFEGWIYLIGSLGYVDEREFEKAQVVRLCTSDFHIERLVTSGDDPGWISRHSARLEGPGIVLVSGGKVSTQEDYRDMTQRYLFDLRTHSWSQASASAP